MAAPSWACVSIPLPQPLLRVRSSRASAAPFCAGPRSPVATLSAENIPEARAAPWLSMLEQQSYPARSSRTRLLNDSGAAACRDAEAEAPPGKGGGVAESSAELLR